MVRGVTEVVQGVILEVGIMDDLRVDIFSLWESIVFEEILSIDI